MVQFAYTILYVQDVRATLAFYEKAFGLKQKFIAPESDYGELDTGNTVLSFASLQAAKNNMVGDFIESKAGNKPFGVEVAFTTGNVEEVYGTAIKAGATSVAEAKQKPWGQVVAYVRDINGFIIEICTPITS